MSTKATLRRKAAAPKLIGPVRCIADRPFGYAEAGWWWLDRKDWALTDPSRSGRDSVEDDYREDSHP
jgi:hypothetical protein